MDKNAYQIEGSFVNFLIGKSFKHSYLNIHDYCLNSLYKGEEIEMPWGEVETKPFTPCAFYAMYNKGLYYMDIHEVYKNTHVTHGELISAIVVNTNPKWYVYYCMLSFPSHEHGTHTCPGGEYIIINGVQRSGKGEKHTYRIESDGTRRWIEPASHNVTIEDINAGLALVR